MKKLIPFILLFFLTNCEKEYCWYCKITTVTSVTHYYDETSYSVNILCDKTEAEIIDYAGSKSGTETLIIGGTTITTKKTCDCEKK